MRHSRLIALWLLAAVAAISAVAVADAQDGATTLVVRVTDNGPVTLGDDAVYRVAVRNTGGGPADNVRLTVAIDGPPAPASVSATGPCETSGRTVACAWDRIKRGADNAQVVEIRLHPDRTGKLAAAATAAADNAPAVSDAKLTRVKRPGEPDEEPTPDPTPDPTEEPTPDPTATVTPTASASPTTTPADPAPTPTTTPEGEVGGEQARSPLGPIVVRFLGKLTRRGARLTRLYVATPPQVRITVRCVGRRCPYRRKRIVVGERARKTVTVRVRAAERSYSAGTRLEVAIQRRGRVGRYVSYTIRRGKRPLRADACIGSSGRKPRPCPGG